ncbi:MAG: hypothetical protein ACKVW3_02805 [Phycisphaerales bacterium]
MRLPARVERLERTHEQRGCAACATERVVVVPDIAAADDPKLRRCERCGRDISDLTKIVAGSCWSEA